MAEALTAAPEVHLSGGVLVRWYCRECKAHTAHVEVGHDGLGGELLCAEHDLPPGKSLASLPKAFMRNGRFDWVKLAITMRST